MRRVVVAVSLLVSTGCHRLSDRTGEAGALRHGVGFNVASQISVWLGLVAVGAGLLALLVAGVRRVRNSDTERPSMAGAGLLLGLGLITVVGMVWSSIGLWVCRGSC